MVRPANLKGVEFTGAQGKVVKFIENRRFSLTITFLILINAIILGLETDEYIHLHYGQMLAVVDHLILSVFVVEMLLKIFVYRLSFFKAGWNVFDVIVVVISLLPATGPLSVLRALRILRVLRLMSVVPQMRHVIAALFHAIPGMASIVAVLLILFYVSAVLATKLFGVHPDPNMQEWFGTVAASMYSLFQIMTLEGWSEGMVRPTMQIFPWAWMFFVPFIIITSFAVLNLFIGIIVDAMQRSQEKPREEQVAEIESAVQMETDELHDDLKNVHKELAEIKKLLKQAAK